MKKNILLVAVAACSLFLSSCENDFDAKIYGSFSTTNFPSSESDYENYMMDCYVPYCIKWTYYLSATTHNFYVAEGSTVRLLDGTTDYCAPWSIGGWGDAWLKLTSGSFEDMKYYTRSYSGYPEDFGKTRDVTVMTKIIGTLENAPEEKLSAEKKAQFLGEAHLCRGLMMYYLMQYFGPVPVIVDPAKVGDSEAESNFTRPSLDEYTQYITDDFEFAAANAPETQAEKGRYTADYARVCLMRHYLNEGYHMTGYYQKAADLFNKFTGNYSLYKDGDNPYADQFKIAHEFNSETIMAVSCSSDATGSGTQGNFNPWSWYLVPSNAAKYDGDGNPTPFEKQGGGWGQCFNIDPKYYDTFETGDKRAETILTSYYDKRYGWVTRKDIGSYWTGFVVNKYPVETATSFQGTDFPLARWADVLLLYAEALVRTNNTVNSTAVDCVNQVRNRAGLANLTSDKTSSLSNFLDALLAERGHELMYEGCRKVDLIRFGKYYTTMKEYGRTPSSEYFPIPNYAIEQAEATGCSLSQYFYTSNYDGPTN